MNLHVAKMCCWVVCGGLGFGSCASAMTLPEAIRHTLDTNPEVMASQHELLSREQEVRHARAAYLPTVDAAAGIGTQTIQTPSTGGDDVTLTRRESSLSARQLVFDGYATSEEVSRQKARYDSALYKSTSVGENVALRATEVYLNVLRHNELMDIARETLYEHQNIHDQMVLRNSSGVGSKADLDQITSRLALAESNVITANNNLLDAQTNFFRVTGMEAQLGELDFPVTPTSIPPTLSDAEVVALKSHPTLMSADADINAAEAQYRTSESPFWPRLHLEADKRWDENVDGVEGDNEDLVIALRMRYNLYNGGGDSARRKQTEVV